MSDSLINQLATIGAQMASAKESHNVELYNHLAAQYNTLLESLTPDVESTPNGYERELEIIDTERLAKKLSGITNVIDGCVRNIYKGKYSVEECRFLVMKLQTAIEEIKGIDVEYAQIEAEARRKRYTGLKESDI